MRGTRYRLGGGTCLALLGLALLALGCWIGWSAVAQYWSRPPPARDVAVYIGVFVLVFFAAAQVGAGLGVIAGGVNLAREGARRASYPDQPWMWRADWAAGLIKHSLGRAAVLAWLAVVGWHAVLWGALLPLVPLGTWLETGAYWGLACVALSSLLGVGLLAWATLATWRWWRSRESVFEMASVPGRIGGELDGAVRAQVAAKGERVFRVRLVCEQSPGLGGTRQALWQPEYTVGGDEVAISAQYSAIPVRFEIPASCRPSSLAVRNPIVWRVEVATTGAGAGYRAEFLVPVFRANGAEQPGAGAEADTAAPQGDADA